MERDEQPTIIDVQKYLGGISYPQSRDDIVAFAEAHHAPPEVTDALRSIPDREFAGPTELTKALTEALEGEDTRLI